MRRDVKFLKNASEGGRSRSIRSNENGSRTQYSYIANSVSRPPGTIASYSDNNTSSALDERCFHIMRLVAFSRVVVEIKVGFWLQRIVEIM